MKSNNKIKGLTLLGKNYIISIDIVVENNA